MSYDIKYLSKVAYEAKTIDAAVLSADGYGDKVLRLTDGNALKLFRSKRIVSSANLFPYAVRFAKNVDQLHEKNIKTVEWLTLWNIPHLQRTAVEYQPLLGTSLREIAAKERQLPFDLIVKFAEFIAVLHEKGVYFRSLHLGNVLLLTSLQMGIIDCADMRIKSGSLSVGLRVRNFRHLMRYKQDLESLIRPNVSLFIESYIDNVPEKLKNRLKIKLVEQQAMFVDSRSKHSDRRK